MRKTRRQGRKPLRCLLCGAVATLEAIYFPGPKQIAKGIFRYGLCDACFAQPGHVEGPCPSLLFRVVTGLPEPGPFRVGGTDSAAAVAGHPFKAESGR